ncbi:MAG: bifunctional DNA primase/polymerase [Gemmataceae bacterium]|nr:bifunctional DNA primase/polymerase [Gemmataceae bacterium]
MSNLQAALDLAARGCRVFPIHRAGKKPPLRGWPRLATADAAAVERWWGRWPDANVGIHTAGLLVFDVDGPVGHADLERLRGAYPLPPTLTIVSGNLGESHHYQLLYRLPPGVRALNKPLDQYPGFRDCDKIDIKSTRGQVVGPGSIHPTGGVYRWEREPADVYREAAEAPEWAVRALCRPEETVRSRGDRDRSGVPERPEESPDGDDALLSVLRARWPVVRPGQRSCLMAGVVGWLFGKRLPPGRVVRVATAWLEGFQGVFATLYDRALRDLYALVHRTARNQDKGVFRPPVDHEELTARQELLPELSDFLADCEDAIPLSAPRGRRAPNVWCSPARRSLEVGFLRSLLLHYQYEAGKGECDRIPLTDRQLQAVYGRAEGRGLSWKGLWAMKAKYFGAAASRRTLLVMQEAGTFGRPSLYRVARIPPLWSFARQDPVDEHQVLPVGGDAEQAQEGPSFRAGGAEDMPGGPDAAWWLDEPGEPREAVAGPDKPWWSDPS